MDDKDWLDEVAGGEVMFPDETPDRLGTAAAAGTEKRLAGHGRNTRERRAAPQPRKNPYGNRGMPVAAL